jgi:hypothetical protein
MASRCQAQPLSSRPGGLQDLGCALRVVFEHPGDRSPISHSSTANRAGQAGGIVRIMPTTSAWSGSQGHRVGAAAQRADLGGRVAGRPGQSEQGCWGPGLNRNLSSERGTMGPHGASVILGLLAQNGTSPSSAPFLASVVPLIERIFAPAGLLAPLEAIKKDPLRRKESNRMEPSGLEPLTPCMPCRCSTS